MSIPAKTIYKTTNWRDCIRTIKSNHIDTMKPGVRSEIALVHEMFGIAA